MLHRLERKAKEAEHQHERNLNNQEYQQEWKRQNPGKVAAYTMQHGFVDGEEKTTAVCTCQDPSFEKRKEEISYVVDASNMMTSAHTILGKVQDTRCVKTNQGARKPQNGDTDLDNAIDPVCTCEQLNADFIGEIAMTSTVESRQSQSLKNGQPLFSSGKRRWLVLSELQKMELVNSYDCRCQWHR